MSDIPLDGLNPGEVILDEIGSQELGLDTPDLGTLSLDGSVPDELALEDPVQQGLIELEFLGYPVRGMSAYEVAVKLGFSGTEAEWLLTLVGPESPNAPIALAAQAGAVAARDLAEQYKNTASTAALNSGLFADRAEAAALRAEGAADGLNQTVQTVEGIALAIGFIKLDIDAKHTDIDSWATSTFTARNEAQTARAGAEAFSLQAAESYTSAELAVSAATQQAVLATDASNLAGDAAEAAVLSEDRARSYADDSLVEADASRTAAIQAKAFRDQSGLNAAAGILYRDQAEASAGEAEAFAQAASDKVVEAEIIMTGNALPNLIDNSDFNNGTIGWTAAGGAGAAGWSVKYDPLFGSYAELGNLLTLTSKDYPAVAGAKLAIAVDGSTTVANTKVEVRWVPSLTLAASVTDFHLPNDWSQRRKSLNSVVAPAGTTGFRVVVTKTNATIFKVTRIKVNTGDKASSYSEDATVRSIQAQVNINELARVTADDAFASRQTKVEASISTRPNLLSNSTFAQDLTDWTADASWSTTAASDFGPCATAAANGNSSLISASFPVTPSAPYVMSGDLRFNATGGSVLIETLWYNSVGTFLIASTPISKNAVEEFGVERKEAAFAAPATATLARVRIRGVSVTGVVSIGARYIKFERGAAPSTVWSDERTSTKLHASITELSSVSADVWGRLNAKHGVKLDVNGYVSGTESQNNGTTSSFTVLADNFKVVMPGNTAKTPFSVSANRIQMNSDVDINGNLIVSGTVKTGGLEDNAITNQVTSYSAAEFEYIPGFQGIYKVIRQVTIVTTGGRVEILGNFNIEANTAGGRITLWSQILRNGFAQLTNYNNSLAENSKSEAVIMGAQPVMFTDNPPAGVHTYTYHARLEVAGGSLELTKWWSTYLSATEVKR